MFLPGLAPRVVSTCKAALQAVRLTYLSLVSGAVVSPETPVSYGSKKNHWFFSLFSFLFVVKVQWQLLALYMWNWKPEAHLTFQGHFFTGNDCVCTIWSLLEFSIFQKRLFYSVQVTVYRVLPPHLQVCKVLPLFFTMLSSQQLWKVILIFQTRSASDMYMLLVQIHTTAESKRVKCSSERVFFSPLDLRKIISFQSAPLVLCVMLWLATLSFIK